MTPPPDATPVLRICGKPICDVSDDELNVFISKMPPGLDTECQWGDATVRELLQEIVRLRAEVDELSDAKDYYMRQAGQ